MPKEITIPDPEPKPLEPKNLDSIKGIAWFQRSMKYNLNLMKNQDEVKEYQNDLKYKTNQEECLNCEEYKSWMLSYSPSVRFMIDEINKVNQSKGVDSNDVKDSIMCDFCEGWKGGGFHPELGILLCSNRIRDKFQLEDILTHELVHYYDNLKFKVNWANLKHHACSEIRASSLSGECRLTKQFWLGALSKFKMGHQDCVKRRAVLSVMANPLCDGDKKKAEKVVEEVWTSCLNDTRPFERIYR